MLLALCRYLYRVLSLLKAVNVKKKLDHSQITKPEKEELGSMLRCNFENYYIRQKLLKKVFYRQSNCNTFIYRTYANGKQLFLQFFLKSPASPQSSKE
ncbi:hypothetical protein CEXT_321891 [Caerostris extrusa]|uniref:Uncharacterized protein n=1 Tax=Caerostris extrusa TaxID=172846 RepID=A0AAV4RY80_CAEEX|nr:hypothetical protein CEXT_321891 [Caerostris extrusa]